MLDIINNAENVWRWSSFKAIITLQFPTFLIYSSLLGVGRAFSWSETELWTHSSLLKQWLRLLAPEIRSWAKTRFFWPERSGARSKAKEFFGAIDGAGATFVPVSQPWKIHITKSHNISGIFIFNVSSIESFNFGNFNIWKFHNLIISKLGVPSWKVTIFPVSVFNGSIIVSFNLENFNMWSFTFGSSEIWFVCLLHYVLDFSHTRGCPFRHSTKCSNSVLHGRLSH